MPVENRENVHAIQQTLLQIEQECDAFDIRIDGVPIWEHVRFPLHREIMESFLGQAHTETKRSLRDYFDAVSLWVKNTVVRNPFLGSDSDILFWGHERRKQREDGLWWDIYCDPVHDSLDADAVHIESPYLNGHKTPAKTENLKYMDVIRYTGTFQRKLGLVTQEIPKSTQKRLTTIGNRIERELNVTVDVPEFTRHRLLVRKSVKPLYEKLIRRIDPNLVILVVSYGKEPFIEACHEHDVPVVELQHGTIEKHHYGYNFPEDRTKESFPDYLFTFGDFWAEGADFPIDDQRVRSVGYPYLEQMLQKYQSVSSTDKITFISQGTIGANLSKFAVEVSDHPELDAEIVYKLHPGEYDRWQREYPWLRDSDVTVSDGSEKSIYQWFAESEMLVGVYSTAMYEGLLFDTKICLVDLPGIEFAERLAESEYVPTIDSVEELLQVYRDDTENRGRPRELFEPNAIENIVRELNEIPMEKR